MSRADFQRYFGEVASTRTQRERHWYFESFSEGGYDMNDETPAEYRAAVVCWEIAMRACHGLVTHLLVNSGECVVPGVDAELRWSHPAYEEDDVR